MSLGTAPQSADGSPYLQSANVIQGAQCLGIPPVTPTVEPVSAND